MKPLNKNFSLKVGTNLSHLVKHMKPYLHEEPYVYVLRNDLEGVQLKDCWTICRENEGYTLILEKRMAEKYCWTYSREMARITLEVYSSLEAVGFTAAISSALAAEHISCNVIAAYHHDHLLVTYSEGDKALNILRRLSKMGDFQ